MVELETINLLVQIVGVSATAIAAVIGVRSYIVFDRDKVKVKGRWQSSGRLRLSEIENLTTKNKTKV